MLSITDILTAINDKILDNIENVIINSDDISEGFFRPSFFISFSNVKRSNISEYHFQKSMTVRIYYFSTNRNNNSIELMLMQEQLESLFNLKLTVSDRELNITDTDSNITQSDTTQGSINNEILIFSFDLEYYDSLDSPDYDSMENLYIE